VTGLNEINSYFSTVQSQMSQTRKDTLNEAAQYFLKDALANVHVISGRTKSSTRISSVSENEAVIESGFGAPFEEKRDGTKFGTPHKFMSGAAQRTASALPDIIRRNYDKLLTPK
jgi:hypothetical protein